ncbi:hypothetical protein EMPS_07505 [Entomortierella parvispora]|uniref:F-box domain-containing protein n=1 Tax=Entomortierella parvispora TaxID=205924 RepID=A0A9P3HEI1_9FUNG|nr:hypothetical protein EMPS_07505 [Entomortierella parvispora]
MSLFSPLLEKLTFSTMRSGSTASFEVIEPHTSQPPPTFTAGHAVPEIMQEIFSYLSQQDLIRKASQVNRLWRSISMFYIRGKVSWQDTMTTKEQELALLGIGLEGTKILQLWAQDSRVYPAYDEGVEKLVGAAWDALAETIRSMTAVQEGGARLDRHGQGNTVRNRPQWQTLIFCGDIKWLSLQLEPWILQGSLGSLSTLRLLHLTPGPIDLSCILCELSNLTELVIESMEGRPFASKRNVTITWETRTMQEEGGEDTQEGGGEDGWTLVLPKLKIRTLSLRSILVNQSILETLFRSMPQLRSLELVSVLQPKDTFHVEKHRSDGRMDPFDPHHYLDRVRLLEFLAEHCPCLAHFHLSMNTRWWKLSQNDMVRMASRFPNLKSFSCMTMDIKPETLPLFVDRLTTLELTSNGHLINVRSTLHWYLCHAPLLLHLKAPGVLTFADDLILDPTWKHNGPPRASMSSSRPHPPVETLNFEGRVWACRDLKTINVCMETQRLLHYTARRRSESGDEVGSSNNRRLFAYLSLVCPKLEEITLEGSQLEISVQSGLVFLSRLNRLRRLRLFVSLTPWLEKGSLDWMRIGWGMWPPPPPWRTPVSWTQTAGPFQYLTEPYSPRVNAKRQTPWIGLLLGRYEERRLAKEKITYQESLLRGLESTTADLRNKAKTLALPSYYPDRSTIDEFMRSKEQHDPSNDSDPPPLHPIELVTMEALDHVAERFQELTSMQRQIVEGKSEKRIWPHVESFEVHMTKKLAPHAMRCILQMRPDLQAWEEAE